MSHAVVFEVRHILLMAMQSLATKLRTSLRRPGSWRWGPSAVRRCAPRVVTALALAAALGCPTLRSTASAADDSTDVVPDTLNRVLADSPSVVPESLAAVAAAQRRAPSTALPAFVRTRAVTVPRLTPLADSVSQFLVFTPIEQTWFLASKRGKRLLVDIGRVDLDVQHDKKRATAYQQAVKALSPIPIGTPVRIHHEWGTEDDSISGFSTWNGRIVATLHLSHQLDSLVRHAPVAYAAVERTDTASPPNSDSTARLADSAPPAPTLAAAPRADSTAAVHGPGRPAAGDTAAHRPTQSAAAVDSAVRQDSCVRDSVAPALLVRAAAVRDSIDLWLRSLPPPPYDRLVNTLRSQSTELKGCFGNGNRLAIAVDLRAGANEWIRERAVLVDTLGRVTNLRVYDFRFKAHDFLAALDPNGSGTDGIVARGLTQGEGGIVVLALEPGLHLTRWVGGFSWEAR
jgi:hypothetical protein